MAEPKPAAQPKQTAYFVGEIEQETAQGRLFIPVIARPDGTALTQMQAEVEILNKLDAIMALIKQSL
jgi:hypothetical protein